MRASILLASAVLSGIASAQSFFQLSTGELCEGLIAGHGADARIETAVGRLALGQDTRAMRRDPFDAHECVSLAEYGLAEDNAAAQVAVAEFAGSRGVWSSARQHLNRALELDPDSGPALALAAKWAERFHMSAFEDGPKPNPRKALEAWLKDGVTKDWVGAAMVQAKMKSMGPDLLLHPMLKTLKANEAPARWCAARVLKDFRSAPDRIKPLYRRSILDPSPTIRTECVRALKVTQDPVFCKLFAKSLASKNQAIRIAAAEALGELELPEGAEPIVRLLSGDVPVAPRAYVASVTQVAYVKDYDVQVAQNAVIADPIVDIVQEGTVLDVAVVSIQTERGAYFGALRRMTKQDFGTDLGKWRSYLKMPPPETAGG